MSREIRIAVTVRLPDDAEQAAAHCQAIFAAWRDFANALKPTNPQLNEFTLGTAKAPRRRKGGRPRLVGAEPPPTAA